jgi:hypothetical protein
MLGAWDTLYYHEWRLRLPSQPNAKTELRLHASRDFVYALLFGSIGWVTWNGAFAALLLVLLSVEIVITLWDFLEEDNTRKLPSGERIGHALMGIVYGLFLAYVVPEIWQWLSFPTGISRVDHKPIAWLLSLMAAGVFISGVRDIISVHRLESSTK